MRRSDPVLHTVALSDLRPTQMTVGLREVAERRKAWQDATGKARERMLANHVVPAVLGPKGRYYIVDHHHLARAMLDAGATGLFVHALADFSRLGKAEFWMMLDQHGWVHTYDARGRRRDFDAMPRSLAALADDPFRSLAGAVRRAGGFAKDTTPFAEFGWAQFFRSRVAKRAVERDFTAALRVCLALARSAEADYLPGWCGPARPAARRGRA